MSKELVISANRHETKVAILEDDQLVEVFFQRANEYSLAGSIHKGRVTRVLPGMQSAFVDLGLERDTFLYVSDFFEDNEDFDRVSVTREAPRVERASRAPAEISAPEEAPSVREPAAVASTEPSEAAPAASAAPNRGDDGDRDRRGRRSRRRRNRGHGFPDSKYASEVSRAPRVAEEAPVVAEPSFSAPANPPATGDFAVLPGESLAKYTRSNIQPLDDAEEEEIRNLQESGEPAASAEIASEAVEEPDDAPLAEDVEAASEAEEDSAASLSEPPADAAAQQDESDEESETGSALAAEAEPAGAEASMAAFEGGAASDEEAQNTGAAPQQRTAQVRDQGGRSMHRLPRRMRRRGRRGGPGESNYEQEPRGEAGSTAAPGETTIARPETPRPSSRPEKAPLPSITELLKEGQEIIVQIAKEPLGQKGARITSHIALPGRYVVYMPTVDHTGVSRKIASDDERLRLKRILQVHHAGIAGGFIVRTAGEGKTEEELAADMNFLANLWLDIRQKAERKPAPLLLHHDLDIVQRILRDQLTEQFKAIWVDNEELYESVLQFVERFQPGLVSRVKLYTRSAPIFDSFNVTAELEKALRPKVWLKSGGYIVINQTEALVAIDVNTGKYVGRSNRLEDTIVKTNTEAVKEIVRQVRLRDLGGIIVVDFIDMDERKNRQKVMQALEDAMRADRAPYKILQFNDFGLVAITRKRVKQSLERALCMPCPHCEGAGYVKSVATIVSEILQEAIKIGASIESKDVILRVHPDVAKFLKSHQNKYLEELEEVLRRPVLVQADPLLHHEKFDLA
jgi:ribonuclease G